MIKAHEKSFQYDTSLFIVIYICTMMSGVAVDGHFVGVILGTFCSNG